MIEAFKRAAAKAANGTVKAKAATLKSTVAMERFKEMVLAHAAQVKAEAVAEVPKEKLAPGWTRTSIHFIQKRSA
jgi:hypothetical protein